MSNDVVVTNGGGGIGFIGALTILFIGLKLTDIIAWSWIWVLSPIWISFGVTIIALLVLWYLAKKDSKYYGG